MPKSYLSRKFVDMEYAKDYARHQRSISESVLRRGKTVYHYKK